MSEERPDRTDLQLHRYRYKSSTRSTYDRMSGLLVIPVMGPEDTPPVLARVHAPYGTREVDFEYAKEGSPPLMPAADDTDSGDILLGASHTFPAPSTTQGGALVYGVTGSMLFLQPGSGRAQGDPFPIDRHPFPTIIDMLGAFPKKPFSPGMSIEERIVSAFYNNPELDTTTLTSYGIIL